ncbi:MAG: ketoacyl-ACP synthase III [Candidatus Rokubacteria bacterium]|nr:ketoacyl-ACP synthase III [Candidatus Rokubacteria bacterium]MBI3107300.1 ketoacyl-ACP synthase III [Candidatus Rokubacteria bacterium]
MKIARIIATGMAVPECVVDNALLSRCMDTSDEWITQRTGIRERRMSPDTYRMLLRLAEAPDKTAFMRDVRDHGLDGSIDSTLMVSDLALEASRMALKHAGLRAEDLDCIIDSSTLPDFAYPHTGCVLQGKLGLTTTPVFNLQQGCAGFIYGLAMGDQFIRGGMFDRVLVVGAELLSSMFDYTDIGRDMAVLFADGAGAAVLQAEEAPATGTRRGLLSHHLHSDGSHLDALAGELWGSSTFPPVSKKKIEDGRSLPRMNGRTVFVQAVRRFREVVRECLEANALQASDVDLFIFHQANMRIIEAVAETFKIPRERAYNNLERYGNTAAASVPICLHEALTQGRIKDGDLILLAAFGTGFSWGATLIRW